MFLLRSYFVLCIDEIFEVVKLKILFTWTPVCVRLKNGFGTKMRGKAAMMNDFLKVNQEDDEDLKKLKQFSQKAIDEGNFEDLAFINLISATSVVEVLKSSLDFENDKEKVKLLSDFLHYIYHSYRDTVVFKTLNSMVELVESVQSKEHIINTLLQGIEMIKFKILDANHREKDTFQKMKAMFPELRDEK
jgi:hypothetical protein